MKLKTWCIQEPPSPVLDELFQTFVKSLPLGILLIQARVFFLMGMVNGGHGWTGVVDVDL